MAYAPEAIIIRCTRMECFSVSFHAPIMRRTTCSGPEQCSRKFFVGHGLRERVGSPLAHRLCWRSFLLQIDQYVYAFVTPTRATCARRWIGKAGNMLGRDNGTRTQPAIADDHLQYDDGAVRVQIYVASAVRGD
jgi:hypothetical protein